MRSTLLLVLAMLGGTLLFATKSVTAADERGTTPDSGQAPARETSVVEIRSYNLKPGTRERFRRLFLDEAYPMLKRANIDVVAYGPSLHDPDSWFLMRSFESVEGRQASEDAFYGSKEWIDGPRQAVLDCIESYTTVVIEADAATIAVLRKATPRE
jgi:hypothetical protein